MKAAIILGVGAIAQAAAATLPIRPKNVIFVVPDGMGPASVTFARTYLSMLDGGSPTSPNIPSIALDKVPVGNTRTHSSNRLVTDSAAAGTALAAGFKTENGAIGVLPDGQPVANILEAAKLRGYYTALVVTSTINHATPAAFSSHVLNRNDLAAIATQQIGYSNHLNQSVDLLFGGGRCYFRPQNQQDSCREDDVDLFTYAEEQGYYVAQNRSQFDDIEFGLGDIRLPILGLFHDNDLSYETDRRLQSKEEAEPSLSDMTKTALNALNRAIESEDKGYFMMIESSRIDHSSHASDPVAHIHDMLEYNRVIEIVMKWIDDHEDTIFISVADHETGGMTLPSNYDPRPLQQAKHSIEYLSALWDNNESDNRDFLAKEILPAYGLPNATSEVIDKVLSGEFEAMLASVMNELIGMKWSTGGHSAVDTTLYAYAKGDLGRQLKADLAGSHDNTEIARFIEKYLGLDMDKTTELLRENW